MCVLFSLFRLSAVEVEGCVCVRVCVCVCVCACVCECVYTCLHTVSCFPLFPTALNQPRGFEALVIERGSSPHMRARARDPHYYQHYKGYTQQLRIALIYLFTVIFSKPTGIFNCSALPLR